MANAQQEKVTPPFMTFSFAVEITVSGTSDNICSAAFSECDGLEMTMEPKTLREGGNNKQPHHLVGPVSYGTLSLKRGMTSNFDIWQWFERTHRNLNGRRLRADADVIIYDTAMKSGSDNSDREVKAKFRLTRCLPLKLRVPSLNAVSGEIAIEEFELAYETMELKEN